MRETRSTPIALRLTRPVMPPAKVDEATVRRLMAEAGEKFPEPPKKERATRKKSGLEISFETHLLSRVRNGVSRRFLYEPFLINVIDLETDGPHRGKTKYTPDFIEFMSDGSVNIYETKGFERSKDMIRFRAAVAMFPEWNFYLVKRPTGAADFIIERFWRSA